MVSDERRPHRGFVRRFPEQRNKKRVSQRYQRAMSRSDRSDDGERPEKRRAGGGFAASLQRDLTELVMLIVKGVFTFFAFLVLFFLVRGFVNNFLFLGFVSRFFLTVLLSLVILVAGRRLYRRIRGKPANDPERLESDPDPEVDPEPVEKPEPESEPWQDVVVVEVEDRRNRKDLVLQNTSDDPWDLSGAILVDDRGEEFTFRDGLVINPGDRESLPVEKHLDVTYGAPVTLRTKSGEQYELPWLSVVRERRSNDQ
ncbi:lamin tail domain-containing protein [Halogeometricum sp. S1BR25-6]|uniref:Lamin tail domain-containing protein n=1 Tax=Halogeometricum salsisoli TaxID=2950536 RepID=A0ABU2GL41_9EURY|nr:hypothetical protein [Halogeometricum sp. S1BR25-6]MDS0301116.1 lamin tail domain-containing protein [Halogeometricum sp. S1BR25-6]